MTRRRLEDELVRRGLVPSRADARVAVSAGLVTASRAPATNPAALVTPGEALDVRAAPRSFVSRGGDKLRHALDRFSIDPAGRECLDAGASTGGFTDCLLQAGAARVVAVDVGYGQLAWRLRTDSRVTVLERTNVRGLQPGDLPFSPSVVVADLSFISLRVVLPSLARVARSDAEFVLLVKPQFEAERWEVGTGGVVSDPVVRRRTVETIARACRNLELAPRGVTASPTPGPAGNVEFLLHAVAGGAEVGLEEALAEAVAR